MMHVIPYDQTKMPVLPNDLGTKTPSCQTRCVLLYNSKNWYTTEYRFVSSDQRKYPSTKLSVTFYGNNKIAGQNPRSKHHLSISLARQTCLYRTVCLLKIKHAFGTHCFPEKLIKKQSSKIDMDTDNLKCYFHGTLGLCKSIRHKKQIVRTMALRQAVFCNKKVHSFVYKCVHTIQEQLLYNQDDTWVKMQFSYINTLLYITENYTTQLTFWLKRNHRQSLSMHANTTMSCVWNF